MKRKLRTFGVAAIAALAISAVAAVAAAAIDFHSEATTTVTGTSTGKHVLDVAGANLICHNAVFTGRMPPGTHETLTIDAEYDECVFLYFDTDVYMNGCDYVLHASGILDIAGTGCKGIAFEGAACKVVIPPQTGLKSISFTNTGSGASRHVDLSMDLTGITYTATGFCPNNGERTNGRYTSGPTTLTGDQGGFWVE